MGLLKDSFRRKNKEGLCSKGLKYIFNNVIIFLHFKRDAPYWYVHLMKDRDYQVGEILQLSII